MLIWKGVEGLKGYKYILECVAYKLDPFKPQPQFVNVANLHRPNPAGMGSMPIVWYYSDETIGEESIGEDEHDEDVGNQYLGKI